MTYHVQIRLVSYLKDLAGFKEKSFRLQTPKKIKEIISFDIPDDRLVVIIDHVDGGTMESMIKKDSYILISPLFGGGIKKQVG